MRSLDGLFLTGTVQPSDGVYFPRSLVISSNAQLENIDALAGITTIIGDCQVNENPALTSLAGLAGVTQITGDLWVHNNVQLPQCEADELLGQLVDFSGSASFCGNLADACGYTECPPPPDWGG